MAAVANVSVAMQKQILELHAQGMTARKIARVLKVGRNTIRRVINKNTIMQPGAVVPLWATSIDWEKVRLEVARGVPLNILAREYASDVISYVQFWRQFHKKYPDVPKVTMRLTHVPGEKCFFDYTEGIDIVDQATGEIRSTSLMCGVMAMSSYTFGEFTFTERRDDLIRSMENAFRYFGGVTPYVTVDNQKAAVNQAHWYDPDVNPAFVDFANHWGFAVIPARPFRTHARLLGKEIYSTDLRHYPAEKVALTQFSVKLALTAAEKIGPETTKLVESLLGGNYPLRYLRRVQGILRLHQTGKVTTAGLEHASRMAMTYGKLQFAYVQSVA